MTEHRLYDPANPPDFFEPTWYHKWTATTGAPGCSTVTTRGALVRHWKR